MDQGNGYMSVDQGRFEFNDNIVNLNSFLVFLGIAEDIGIPGI
jgi:hypothetical protein